jgi:CubicO group peptidase (beta-lactamase class C family)
MRRPRPILAAVLVAIGLASLAPSARGETRLADDLAPLVRRLMARDHIPGVAVGIIERGRIVFAGGFGYRDVEHHLPVTPDTLFPLGSCSKAFTATAVAMLADEGRIALDAPVRAYLPDFSLQDAVASASLTPRDLLTHRSGLPRHDLFWYRAPFSRDELYRRLRFLEPSGPPRAGWRYNSLMFVVASRIVEKVSGQRWERFVQARILAPLHMRRTLLSAESMEIDPDHASPYAIRDGRARKIPMLKRLGAIAPAGAVQTTLRDLARWLSFHASRSPALLGEALWRELHRPQAAMPALDEPEVQERAYALGWIHERYRGHRLVVHNGSIDGFIVHLGFLPETEQGVIVLMNRDLATEALMALAYSAYDRLLGLEPIDWARRLEEAPTSPQAVRETTLDFPIEQVLGTYRHPAYGIVTIRADGDKLAMRFRSVRVTLAYQGQRQFLSKGPIVEGAPQVSVRFSEPSPGELPQLFVPLNWDEGDPVEVFTRVRSGETGRRVRSSHREAGAQARRAP